MNGALGHDSALLGYIGPGTTCANEMNFGMNHAPDAGSIIQPVDLQPSTQYNCATTAPICQVNQILKSHT